MLTKMTKYRIHAVCIAGLASAVMILPCNANPTSPDNCELALEKIVSRLQQVQAELAINRARFTEEHPQVQALKTSEEELNRLLQQEHRSCPPSSQTVIRLW
jgi:hypothetical protein